MKDPIAEQRLAREGVEWHTEKDIPLSEIDWEASLKNQARLKISLIPEHVDELAMAVIEGAQLPDPVGYWNKDRRIIIISGNHRGAAYRKVNELNLSKRIEKIDWYIVNTYPWKIDYLTRTFNIDNGIPLSAEDRLEQAKHLVRVLKYSVTDAAKSLAISVETVNRALQADDVRERLAKYRFTDNIPFSTLHRLYRIKQDNALLETATLVTEAVLSGDEATVVARKIAKAAASEKQQSHVLAELRREYKDRIARTKRGQMRRQISPTIKYSKGVNAVNATRPETVAPMEPELMKQSKSAIKKHLEIIKLTEELQKIEEIIKSEQPS